MRQGEVTRHNQYIELTKQKYPHLKTRGFWKEWKSQYPYTVAELYEMGEDDYDKVVEEWYKTHHERSSPENFLEDSRHIVPDLYFIDWEKKIVQFYEVVDQNNIYTNYSDSPGTADKLAYMWDDFDQSSEWNFEAYIIYCAGEPTPVEFDCWEHFYYTMRGDKREVSEEELFFGSHCVKCEFGHKVKTKEDKLCENLEGASIGDRQGPLYPKGWSFDNEGKIHCNLYKEVLGGNNYV